MRRCNRHFRTPDEPYQEFHFENSLRKYQVCPRKKIKLRTEVNPNSATPLEEVRNKLDAAAWPQQKQKSEAVPYPQQHYQEKEGQIAPEVQGSECSMQQLQLQAAILKHLDRVQESSNAGCKDQNQPLSSDKICQPLQTLMNCHHQTQRQQITVLTLRSKAEKEKCLSEHEQPQGASCDINSGAVLGNGEEVDRQNHREEEGHQGGRLNLTGNVSISLRRLAKHKQKGFTESQLLQELLKQRSYLQGERSEIALILKDFLLQN